MSFPVKAELLLNIANWQKNLQKSSHQIAGFGKSMKTVANGVKAAWAGVTLLAFGAVGDAIKDVTKAAADDAKSQRILAGVVANNIKGGKKYTAEIEKQIGAWQLMAAVQDDKIRPAYGYLIRATKSVTKSNRLMQISLDLAAGAHVSVEAAASAVGRAYNGNLRALDKLAPGVKKLKDPLAEVERRFKGLAAIEGSNDPFMKINIVMDEFKEKLGTAVLPLVQKFADYMASPEFQKALDGVVTQVQEFGTWFASPEGQNTFKEWMKDLKTLIGLAADFLGLVGDVASLLGEDPQKSAGITAAKTAYGSNYKSSADVINKGTGPYMSTVGQAPPVINIKVNPITGDAVANLLKGTAQKRGITVGKMIQ